MRDFLKGFGVLLFFVTVAGVALAFMKPSPRAAPTAPAKPTARQAAEATWTAQRDKLRSECMGSNADTLPPALFKQLLNSCDQQAAAQIGPEEYWASEEEKLQAAEAQRKAYGAGRRGEPANATPPT